MATPRKRSISLGLTNEIKARIRRGDDPADVLRWAQANNRGTNFNQIRNQVNQAARQQDTVRRIRQPRGITDTTLGNLSGCGDRPVRMRMVITFTDAETGVIKEFGHTVDMPSGTRGTPIQILGDVTSRIIREAQSKGYELRNAWYTGGDPAFKIDLAYAECL